MSTAISNATCCSKRKKIHRIYDISSTINNQLGKSITKLYNKVISVTWAFMALLPLEGQIDTIFGLRESNPYINKKYGLFTLALTLLFVGSFIIMPLIGRKNVKHFLRKKLQNFILTPNERSDMFKTIINGTAYHNLNTKIGFIRFITTAVSNLTFGAFYFFLEDGIRMFNSTTKANIQEIKALIGMTIVFCIGFAIWSILKIIYNKLYQKESVRKYSNSDSEEIINHFFKMVTMNEIEGDGLGDVLERESVENLINLSRIYYSKELVAKGK